MPEELWSSLVRLKREYLDEQAHSQSDGCKVHVLTGEDWYTQQALRAVNQAVGRVIRHRHDYGAIIFCDERFSHSNLQSQISRWIQPYINCHAKFGDVVFTLSRFFRDGAICNPKKLELTPNEGMENIKETSTSSSVAKIDSDSFLTPSPQTGRSCTGKSLSSSLENKRGKDRSHLDEVLPANRSSLTPFKEFQDFKLKHATGLLSYEKKLLMTGSKNLSRQNHEINDSTDQPSLSETPIRTETLASCSTKKLKICHTQHSNTSEHASGEKGPEYNALVSAGSSIKVEKSQTYDDKSKQKHQVDNSLSHKEMTQKGGTEFVTQKSNSMQFADSPSGNKETKGATFLIQVKEKLSSAEYNEFVEFMKALKSKAMKISQVLESIVKLFSGPERFPLLERFKDFVPANYRSLYDHYIQAGRETLDKLR